ncbi:hypothetical protein [Cohnella laeviribosi]|uniref:hypothetical protein n=1 Tax=Cohnella laeviribosi TaxID=380174 RepID=UPI00037C9BEA|nr:hypothetical protein [Cohnella laeviribosi]
MAVTTNRRMMKRMMRKQYAGAVIQELQQKGYPGDEAKKGSVPSSGVKLISTE